MSMADPDSLRQMGRNVPRERERDIYIYIYICIHIYIYMYMYDTYVFQTYHTSALEQVCCKAQCRHMCCPFGIVWPLKLPSFQINS